MQNNRVQPQLRENNDIIKRGFDGAIGQNNVQRIFCNDHQGYGITHFCGKMSCLKGLCQKCIKQHNTYHKERNEYSEIETVDDINIQCKQILQTRLKEYSQEQESVYKSLQAEEQNHVQQQIFQRIKDAEDQYQNIVQSYFKTLKQEYDIALRKMDGEKQKINEQINEIEVEKSKFQQLLRQLQENQYEVSTFQHILSQDFSVLISQKKQIIEQQFKQLAKTSPNININFENIHKQIFSICQSSCYLTYSEVQTKQRSIFQIRNESASNFSKLSTNQNLNFNNDQSINSQRNLSQTPLKSESNITTNHNTANNNSPISQQSDRCNYQFKGQNQSKSIRPTYSTSPAPDYKLSVQQQVVQSQPIQIPKLNIQQGLNNLASMNSSQQDDKYIPVNKKIKQKIFDTSPKQISSPRPHHISLQQQSIQQSTKQRIEESNQFPNQSTHNQNNMNYSINTNNQSYNNITANFMSSKQSNLYNTNSSNFNQNMHNSNILQIDQQLSNRSNNVNNQSLSPDFTINNKPTLSSYIPIPTLELKGSYPREINFENNNKIEISNRYNTNNIIQPTQNNQNFNINNNFSPINSINNNSHNDNQQKSNLMNNNPQNNYSTLNIDNDKNNFGQSFTLNNTNNSFNQQNHPHNHNEKNTTDNNIYNRGNSFNPLSLAQNGDRDNYHQSQKQNKELPLNQEYVSKQDAQYNSNNQNKQLQQNEIDIYKKKESDYNNEQNNQENINILNHQKNNKINTFPPQNNNHSNLIEKQLNQNIISKQNNYTNNNLINKNEDDHQNNIQFNNHYKHNQAKNQDFGNSQALNNIRKESSQILTEIAEIQFQCNDFEVRWNNYFKKDSNHQYLHFFQPKSNILHLISIQDLKQASQNNSNNGSLKFYSINMKNDDPSFTIPRFHKSIILSDGSIYLFGGILPSSDHSPYVFKYDFNKYKLIQVTQMICGKSGFGCVYAPFNNSIYVIGGANDEDGITYECERYDLTNNKWFQISQLNYPTFNPAVCYFTANGKHYIYKFGGKSDDNQLEQRIERYDLQNDVWEIVPINILSQLFLSSANCCQINQSQIMVFGGANSGNHETSSSCFLFCVEQDPMDQNQFEHTIRGINHIDLPHLEGFSSQQSIIYDNQLFALQNVSEKKNPEIIYLDRKRIICFNSKNWMVLN